MTSFKKIFQLAHSSSAPWGGDGFVINTLDNADLSGKDTPFSGTNVDVFRTAMNASFLNVDGNFSWGRNGINLPLYANAPLRPGSWNSAGTIFEIANVYQPNSFLAAFGTAIPTQAANAPNASYLTSFQTIQDFGITPTFGATASPTFDPAAFPNAPDWMKNADDWRTYVASGFNDKTFYDYSLRMDWPVPLSEIEDDPIGNSIRPTFVDIKPKYNFYVKQYEEGIENYDDDRLENNLAPLYTYVLPNVYSFASELDSQILDADESPFKLNITMDGGIQGVYDDIVNSAGEKIGESDEGQYFQKFGNVLNYSPQDVSSKVQSGNFNTYQNIIFPINNLDLLDREIGIENQFPMNVTIKFSTDIHTRFSDMLATYNLTSVLTKWVQQNIPRIPDASVITIAPVAQSNNSILPVIGGTPTQTLANILQTQFGNNIPGEKVGVQYGIDDWESPTKDELERTYQNLRILDLGVWLDSLLNDPNTSTTLTDEWLSLLTQSTSSVFMGPNPVIESQIRNPSYAVFYQLMMNSLKLTAEPFIESKFRSFVDLLRNNIPGAQSGRMDAYSETLLYCIEKTPGLIDPGTGNFVASATADDKQFVWFPNSSQIDVLSYVDTQVKYGQPYRYRILAYQMVIGNEYNYKWNPNATRPGTSLTTLTDPDLWAKVCVKNKPCIKLIEIPIYDTTWDSPKGIAVIDSPPVPPNVKIIPYRGVDNKILIWLNGGIGDYYQKPVRILPEDYPELEPSDLLKDIHFKSDDPANEFEIFRLDKRPTQYSDFDQRKIITGERSLPRRSYVDQVQPNRKYYYTFRTRDIHGRVSNPTEVYECEIVTQDEFYYVVSKIIDMNKGKKKKTQKGFKKFLQINPAIQQKFIDEEKLSNWVNAQTATPIIIPDLEAKTQFQNPGKSMWDATGTGKKYKIRIHSKKSGKKIDFNLNFNSTPHIRDDREE